MQRSTRILFMTVGVVLALAIIAIPIAIKFSKKDIGGNWFGAPRSLATNQPPWMIFTVGNPQNISVKNNSIQITIRANKVGSGSGGSLHSTMNMLPRRNVSFAYKVFIPSDFPVSSKGGKLPGVCVGVEKKGCATGGSWKKNAGSLRWMWRSAKNKLLAIGYAYLPGGGSAQTYAMNSTDYKNVCEATGGSGHNLFYKKGGQPFTLRPGTWNSLGMVLSLNDVGRANGSITLSCNGVARTVKNLRFNCGSDRVLVQSVDFVSFAGGSGSEWSLGKDFVFLFKDVQFGAW